MNSTSINLSIITSRKGSVQKRIIADANGRPVKDGNHSLGISEGVGEDVTVDGLQGLAALLSSLESNQALVLGQTGLGKQRIVPKDKLNGQPNTIARSKDFYHWPASIHPLLFDHDPEPGQPELTANEFWADLLQVFPEFAAAGRVVTVSTSSAIYDKCTGQCLKPASGHHTYIVVKGNVERFANLLKHRCWLHGKAFFKLAKQNQQTGVPAILERFLADIAVFSPERLAYEAGACFEADSLFEQRLPEPQVFDGDYINLDALPDLTADEQAQAEANLAAARAKIEAQQLEQTCDRIRTEKPELGKREIKQVARQRIQSANQCLLEPDHLLYAMDGRCFKAGDIDSSYNGLKLKDPQEPSYRDGAQTAIIYASDNGWTIVSQAHGGCKYRLKHPVLGQSNKNLGRQIQRIYNRAAYRYWKRFGKLPDKPQPNPAQTNELYSREYIEQMSAAAAVEWEQQQQIEVGQSEEEKAQFIGKLEAKRGKLRKEVKPNPAAAAVKSAAKGKDDVVVVSSHEEGIQRGLALGKRIFCNASETGQGKSIHDANMTVEKLRELGIDVSRKISVLPDPLNPSNPIYQERYTFVPGRHLGTYLDKSGKKRRVKDNTTAIPFESANCHLAGTPGFSPKMQCMACSHRHRCGTERGDGYGARFEAHEALRYPNNIMSVGRLPDPGTEDMNLLTEAWLTIDEAPQVVEIAKTTHVEPIDIHRKEDQLEQESPEIAAQFKPLLDYLKAAQWQQSSDFNPVHGVPLAAVHNELLDTLWDLIPADENGLIWIGEPGDIPIPFDEIHDIEDTYAEQQRLIFGDKAEKLTQTEYNRLHRLKKKQVPNSENDQQWRGLEAKLEQAGKLNRDDRQSLNLYRSNYLSEDEEYELAKLSERHEATKFQPSTRAELRNKSAQLIKPWFLDHLLVVTGTVPGNIIFNADGSIDITILNEHHTAAIAAAKYVELMSADLPRTKDEVARDYRCNADEVFLFEVDPDKLTSQNYEDRPRNVKRCQVSSTGTMSKQRGATLEAAKCSSVEALEERNPGKHRHYDFKGFRRDKTHFIENVGDNEPYEARVTSISMTVPQPNMGGVLSEYCAKTGQIVGFDDPVFQEFYQKKIKQLIEQTEGRFRAQWRQDEELTLYIFSSRELPVEIDEIISAAEITPDAAVGREKSWFWIDQVIADIAIAGEKLTQTAVVAGVKALNPLQRLNQSWLSQLFSDIPGGWKLFKAIFNAIFKDTDQPQVKNISRTIDQCSKTNNFEITPSELDQIIQFFTTIVELYKQATISAAEVVKEVVSIALSLGSKVWQAVTASMPPELRSQLQSIVLEAYPKMPKWLGVPE